MRSSTSSSNDRLPNVAFGKIWGITLGVLLVGLSSWELALRSAGFPPETSPVVWSIVRARAAQGVPVLVGSSRMQADIDLDVWVEETGGPRPAQLASAGGPALPFLEDLAADEAVRGLVIVDALPFHTFDVGGPSGDFLPEYFSHYARFRVSPAVRAETYLATWLSSTLVWRSPAASPQSLRQQIDGGRRVLEPPASSLRSDRFRPIDFSREVDGGRWTPEGGFQRDAEGVKRWVTKYGRPATPAETAEIIARLERAAQTIRDRGGEVVFVALPACGIRKREEDILYPRAAYWDRLAAGTSSRTINSDDFAELGGLPCYDGSHLDRVAAATFTRRFLQVLFQTEEEGPAASQAGGSSNR